MYKSTKLINGFSTCFRQWKANETHCKFLHGYAIEFKIWFEGDIDYRNWVVDFGVFGRSKHLMNNLTPKEWFKYWFDHTTIIASNDPELEKFKELDNAGLIQLRQMENVGCEMFAEFVFKNINEWVLKETTRRVRVTKVECFENKNNTAIYER